MEQDVEGAVHRDGEVVAACRKVFGAASGDREAVFGDDVLVGCAVPSEQSGHGADNERLGKVEYAADALECGALRRRVSVFTEREGAFCGQAKTGLSLGKVDVLLPHLFEELAFDAFLLAFVVAGCCFVELELAPVDRGLVVGAQAWGWAACAQPVPVEGRQRRIRAFEYLPPERS